MLVSVNVSDDVLWQCFGGDGMDTIRGTQCRHFHFKIFRQSRNQLTLIQGIYDQHTRDIPRYRFYQRHHQIIIFHTIQEN